MALVELNGVSKSFRKGDETITPLDDVSLQIHAGEFVSLMGPSGTGKSTLLNLVSGIDRPDAGTITVDGTNITGLSRSRLADWQRIWDTFSRLTISFQCSRLTRTLNCRPCC